MLDEEALKKDHAVVTLEKDTVIRFKSLPNANTIVLLKGKASRRISLGRKFLFLHYEVGTYLGLEDMLMATTTESMYKIYAGSQYVIWNVKDFMDLFQIQLNVTYDAIIYLSRQLRIYNTRGKKFVSSRIETILDVGQAQEDLQETLYQISFSNENEIPTEIATQILQTYRTGDILMREGELTNELFILTEGSVTVYQKDENNDCEYGKEVAQLNATTMIGEMAQFDGLPRSATIVANTNLKTLVFKPENFNMVFQLHPKWSKMILNSLAQRIINVRNAL